MSNIAYVAGHCSSTDVSSRALHLCLLVITCVALMLEPAGHKVAPNSNPWGHLYLLSFSTFLEFWDKNFLLLLVPALQPFFSSLLKYQPFIRSSYCSYSRKSPSYSCKNTVAFCHFDSKTLANLSGWVGLLTSQNPAAVLISLYIYFLYSVSVTLERELNGTNRYYIEVSILTFSISLPDSCLLRIFVKHYLCTLLIRFYNIHLTDLS